MTEATWNVYLINRGEPPLLYYKNVRDVEVMKGAIHALDKALDGSDADGFVVMRSDYPMPLVWPRRGL